MLKAVEFSVELRDPLTGARAIAVRAADFEVRRGEAVALVGANGAGKSSLILGAAGLAHRVYGSLILDGRSVYEAVKKDPRWFFRRVGIAFQFPERSLFEATVERELSFTSRMLRLPVQAIESGMRRSLRTVGLDERFLNRSPFELSGGEKRRVALAAAICHEPDLLLLDEPEVGLDWRGCLAVREMINAHKAQGGAVLAATHDVEGAVHWADRCLILDDGRIVKDVALDDGDGGDWPSLKRWLRDRGALGALRRSLVGNGRADLPVPYREPLAFARAVERALAGIGS